MAKVEKKLKVCGLDYTLYELTNSETGEKHIDVFKTDSYQLCTLNLSFDNTDKELEDAIRKHYLMKNSRALSETISLYKEALYDLIPEGETKLIYDDNDDEDTGGLVVNFAFSGWDGYEGVYACFDKVQKTTDKEGKVHVDIHSIVWNGVEESNWNDIEDIGFDIESLQYIFDNLDIKGINQ